MTDLIDPAQDLLEIKCHDDYKWAALEIKKLREALKPVEDAEINKCKGYLELLPYVSKPENNQYICDLIDRLARENRELKAENKHLEDRVTSLLMLVDSDNRKGSE